MKKTGRGAAKKAGKPKGTRNPKVKEAIDRGKKAHKEFAEKVKNKPGWESEVTIKGPDGKNYRPDAISPSGKPVELKPRTPTGIKKGAKQIDQYKKALGKKQGKVVYYG